VIKIIVNPMKDTTNNRHYICTVYTVWQHSNGWRFEKKPRKTQDNVEENCGEREINTRMVIMGTGKGDSIYVL